MKYVNSSVVIGIVAETAGSTDEGRLVFTAPTVNGSAGRACLRRVGWIDFNDPKCFVEKHRFDLVPSDVEDSAIETAFLSNVLAGLRNRSACGFCHALCTEALDYHCTVAPRNLGGRLVRPMLADAGLSGLEDGNPTKGLGVPNGPALTPTGNALGFADAPFQQSDSVWKPVCRSIGKHQRDRNASINADRAANVLNISINLAPDGNLPTERGSANGDLGHLAFYIAGHAKPDPTDLRQPNAAPSMVYALNRDLAPVKGKGIVDALLLWLGEPAKSLEGTPVGIIQRLQGVLLSRLAALADKVYFGPKCRQFPRLSNVIQIVAGPGLVVPPVIAALFKRKVPDQSANTRDLTKLFSLIRCRSQCKCETSKNHIKLYRTFNLTSQERAALSSPA